MFLPEQFRSITFRVAMIYTVFFVGSVVAILGTTYLAASSEMASILRSSISDDLESLRNAYRTGGEAMLRQHMDDLAESASEDRFFLMRDSETNSSVIGNVPGSLWSPGWQDWVVSGPVLKQSTDLRLAASRNADGEVLFLGRGERIGRYDVLIGRNAHVLDETQEIILKAMLWGGLVTTLLALLGGFLVSVGPTRRVDKIAATTRQIVEGRLDLRLPVSGRGDELDRLALDINAMLSRIEALLSSLKQVSADIAHDLRTPLARLRQKLETARRQRREPDVYEEVIDDAVVEVDMAIETFNALLRIAQIEAGTRKAKFRRLDLADVARKVCDVYGEVAADANHSLTWHDLSPMPIEGDEELLTQALANLLENAINHVPPPGAIAVAGRSGDGVAMLDIADDGPGVPEAERTRIFQRLYRLDRSRSTPGSGLGLSLVAAIVELHGGRVEALDNEPGLRVRLTLPQARRG
ncbi:cell wall metabolism sensor histidine kinase WalK [Aurantimonas sp. VKM B-3413]|uniref:sensor histidine kinase n=1 Tax=Aurantimonas sp. VKM B-3413 TaxID=2779401 RepID=UPI001E5FF314|nr:ATP-binding protein [Aurantimonas sp. VKM B-3413]MCB8840528.1 HAMP domain-containing protein [Aurantimonas sp. VKM B-3413]